MGRKQPENPNPGQPWPPEVKKQYGESKYEMRIGEVPTNIIVQTRQYKLITPLFGGGVEPGENDPDNLIRATEIRGQLRFWWRAIRGWRYKNIEELKKAESAIWGTASNTEKRERPERPEDPTWKMPVQLEVKVDEYGTDVEAFWARDDEIKGQIRTGPTNNVPVYAAFPLQPEQEERDRAKKASDIQLKTVRKDITFTLTIFFSKEREEDVSAALWAWETFGGIGARTRRGFGAIQQVGDGQYELPPADPLDAESWIKEKLTDWGTKNKFPKGIPHLNPDQLRILGPVANPAFIWNQLINKLKNYRQQRDSYKDRKTGKTKSGPNKWPEAEAIRKRIPGPSLKGSNPNPPDKFPRAVFGLPIVFHFLKEPRADNTILQGKNEKDEKYDRLASPLILRPLGCGNNKALGLAAVLDGWGFPPNGLELVFKRGLSNTINLFQTRLTSDEAKIQALRGISGEEKDALHAFLNYLEKEK